jgi:hypothetical protein
MRRTMTVKKRVVAKDEPSNPAVWKAILVIASMLLLENSEAPARNFSHC